MPNTDKISAILADMIGRNPTIDEALISNGLIDSVLIVEIALHLEELYNISIDVADIRLECFDSVAKICRFVSSKKNPSEVVA